MEAGQILEIDPPPQDFYLEQRTKAAGTIPHCAMCGNPCYIGGGGDYFLRRRSVPGGWFCWSCSGGKAVPPHVLEKLNALNNPPPAEPLPPPSRETILRVFRPQAPPAPAPKSNRRQTIRVAGVLVTMGGDPAPTPKSVIQKLAGALGF